MPKKTKQLTAEQIAEGLSALNEDGHHYLIGWLSNCIKGNEFTPPNKHLAAELSRFVETSAGADIVAHEKGKHYLLTFQTAKLSHAALDRLSLGYRPDYI